LKKVGCISAVAVFALATAHPLCAQGCVDSPENPTAVLGLIVSAAAIAFLQVRNRMNARKDRKNLNLQTERKSV
jgi:hypothetical protein